MEEEKSETKEEAQNDEILSVGTVEAIMEPNIGSERIIKITKYELRKYD